MDMYDPLTDLRRRQGRLLQFPDLVQHMGSVLRKFTCRRVSREVVCSVPLAPLCPGELPFLGSVSRVGGSGFRLWSLGLFFCSGTEGLGFRVGSSYGYV